METDLEASRANGGWKADRYLPKELCIWYVATVIVAIKVTQQPQTRELANHPVTGSNNLGGL